MPNSAAAELLERAIECLREVVVALHHRQRLVEGYVLTAVDSRSKPWSALALSITSRLPGSDDAVPDATLLAAVSVRDLRSFLADALMTDEDSAALLAWLDRPVTLGYIRILAASGADVRAGQFRWRFSEEADSKTSN